MKNTSLSQPMCLWLEDLSVTRTESMNQSTTGVIRSSDTQLAVIFRKATVFKPLCAYTPIVGQCLVSLMVGSENQPVVPISAE